MSKLKVSWMIAKSNFEQWGREYRIWIIGIIETLLLIRYLMGFTQYGIAAQKKITPFLLPVIMADAPISNGLLKIMILFGVIMLFCNAPFLHEQKSYMILRVGRNAWWKGECLYIIIASFLYVAFISVVSLLIVVPCISMDRYWGDLLGAYLKNPTLVFKNNQGLVIPDVLLWNVPPLTAMIYTFFCTWLLCTLLGNLIFVFNITTANKWMGIMIAVIVVLMDPVMYSSFWGERSWLWIFSPATWASMQTLKEFSGMGILTEKTVVWGYVGLLLLSTFFICCKSGRMEIGGKGV